MDVGVQYCSRYNFTNGIIALYCKILTANIRYPLNTFVLLKSYLFGYLKYLLLLSICIISKSGYLHIVYYVIVNSKHLIIIHYN